MRVTLDVADSEIERLAAMIARAGMVPAGEDFAGPAPGSDPWEQDGRQAAPGRTDTAPGPLPGGGMSGAGSRGSAGYVEPRSGGSGSYAGGASNVLTIKGPNGMQTWTLNPPGGPECDCGEPAALIHAPKAKGGFYDAYRCAKGAGDNWRDKCGFNKWT